MNIFLIKEDIFIIVGNGGGERSMKEACLGHTSAAARSLAGCFNLSVREHEFSNELTYLLPCKNQRH